VVPDHAEAVRSGNAPYKVAHFGKFFGESLMSEESKIAIFFCNCGKSLNSRLNFAELESALKEDKSVSVIKEYDLLCTGDILRDMVREVKEKGIERVIIGGCSPKLYGELFAGKLKEAGLDANVVAICNLREQCAWIYKDSHVATKKALNLLKGTLERIKKADPVLEEEILPENRVLIIGGGIAGIEAALELIKLNISVTIVEKEKELGGNTGKLNSFYQAHTKPKEFIEEKINEIKKHEGIEVLADATVISLEGACGDFKARIKFKNNTIEKRCGAVIVATGFETRYPEATYNLPMGGKVITQLQLEEILSNRDKAQKIFGKGEEVSVLFVTGMTGRFSKLSTGTALKNSLLLRERYNNRVFIACRNVLVASEGLEKLYRKIRDEGVLIFKFENKKPEFLLKDGELFALISDYYLSSKVSEELSNPVIKIPCDLIVLEEEFIPSAGYEGLKEILRVNLDSMNFFQKNNVHFFPVESNRKGIFFSGSCRGIEEVADVIADAKSASFKISSLIGGKIIFPKERMVVDKGKCTLCLACQRLCPHVAITYTRAAVISEISCQACGVCASECPNSAITLKTFTDEGIIAEIEEFV